MEVIIKLTNNADGSISALVTSDEPLPKKGTDFTPAHYAAYKAMEAIRMLQNKGGNQAMAITQ